jgi:hypothetical protein
MGSNEAKEGGCACGKLRYRMKRAPLFVHCCHCTRCQRETGSAFALNAMIEADAVDFTGETMIVDTPSESGKGQKVLRCPHCHVAVSSHYGGLGEAVHFLRGGTFDDRRWLKPDIHIYTASKQDWVILGDDVPQAQEYYRSRDYWSPEDIARLKKALG